MSIFVVGMNHKTAPLSLREKVYFAPEKWSLYLQDILHRGIAREALLLSTCNRSELYCEAEALERVREWFCAQAVLTVEEWSSLLYVYRDEKAVAHMMAVACGLDSMVLGEAQILGQMKEAFSEACLAGTIDTLFHRLFQRVFTLAKEIRTATLIGACPVSVASAAIQFVRERLSAFNRAHLLFIGAGETSELLLRYLETDAPQSISIVNRQVDKAAALMRHRGGSIYGLDQLVPALAQADVVFSASGSAMPIVTQAMVAAAIQGREAPLLMLDIAVPRDVEPTVATLDQVQLYCIDDLKVIIDQNRQGREHAARKAYEMIQQKSTLFIQEGASLKPVAQTIRAYREQIEAMCQIELIKAKGQLDQGLDPVLVLDRFAYAFTRKLLHTPSVQLRQAGVEGRFEVLRWAKQLFAIPDPEPSHHEAVCSK